MNGRSAATRTTRWIPTWKQALVAFGLAAILLLLNDLCFFESVLIPSSSMNPTILPGERIFLRKLPRPAFKRFDLVAIDSHKLGRRIAKRIIALPGERVRVENGWQVVVNRRRFSYSDEDLRHERVESGDHAIRLAKPERSVVETKFAKQDLLLGPDEYFVLGDNRLSSDDSRTIGPVTRSQIQGTLGLIWYSFDPRQHKLRTDRFFQMAR